MSKSIDLVLEQAQEIVFGDSVELVDWLYGIAFTVPLLSFDLEGADAIRLQAERLSNLKGAAALNFDRAVLALSGKPPAFHAEVERLRSGMAAMTEAAKIAHPKAESLSKGDDLLRASLFSLLDDEVVDLANEHQVLNRMLMDEVDSFDPAGRDKIAHADRLIVDATGETGTERSTLLREARRILQVESREPGGESAPVLWSRLAWMTWLLSVNVDETIEILETALSMRSMASRHGFSMLARMYAYFLAQRGQFTEAYRWSSTAAEIAPGTGVLHERASYSAATGRGDRAKKDIEVFLKRGRLSILLAFADPFISSFAKDVLDMAVKEQLRIRKDAATAVSAWVGFAKKVTEARRLVGTLPIPRPLLEGAQEAASAVGHANFIVATDLISRAQMSRHKLSEVAHRSLDAERKRHEEVANACRRALEDAWSHQEEYMESALAAQREAVLRLRQMLADPQGLGSKAQRGCAWGLGSGCSIFAIYIFLAGFLAMRGIEIGPESPFCIAAVIAAGVPVLAAIIQQLIYQVKKMEMDDRLNRQIRLTNAAFEKAIQQTEERYQVQMNKLREQLEAAESELKKYDEALKLLC